jgi:acyl-coenzyme A synthetase/AMP-(fatty) acid ligase
MKELPTTPSGKVQKYVLRDGFAKGSYPVMTR